MKKLIFIIIFLNVFSKNVNAKLEGQAHIDSLIVALKHTGEDTTKLKLLNSLCYAYFSIDPDMGIKYGNMALALAGKLNDRKGLMEANSLIGINYHVKSDYPVALDYYLKALKVSEETGNLQKQAGILNNIGSLYSDKGENSTALEYFLKSMEINRKTGNKNWLANNFTNIGSIYIENRDYKQALEYYNKALTIKEELGHRGGIALNLGNIGSAYGEMGDYTRSLDFGKRALQMYEELNDISGISRIHSLMAGTFYRIAMDSNKTLLIRLFKGNQLASLREAEHHIRQSIETDKEIEELEALMNDSRLLSDILNSQGDIKGAFDQFKVYSTIKDSVFNIEKDKKITEAAMQYAFERKEANAKAEQEKQDIWQRNIRNSIAAGLAGALIFLAVVYRQRNKIKEGKRRSDELLLNILPEEVAEELKQKGSADARQFDQVTVMFTDFKGFTQISEKLTPAELVAEIDTCFKAFDQIITRHHIEKIKTIGDAYMCAGGLPVSNKTHAIDVVTAALEIQRYMREQAVERKREGKEIFELRIGIHTGPVVAGIVGVKKFAYDIWGDTVNIASRMEASGEAGKVNISETTHALVGEKFKWIHRGKVSAKGKGEIDMYFVEMET